MEMPYLTITPAVARELTVGFTLELYPTDYNIVEIKITKTGESYLNNPELNLYVDNAIAASSEVLNTISSTTSTYYCNYNETYDAFYIQSYPNPTLAVSEIETVSIYVVLSGTDDNGNSFSTTSNTNYFTKYSDELIYDDNPIPL